MINIYGVPPEFSPEGASFFIKLFAIFDFMLYSISVILFPFGEVIL